MLNTRKDTFDVLRKEVDLYEALCQNNDFFNLKMKKVVLNYIGFIDGSFKKDSSKICRYTVERELKKLLS